MRARAGRPALLTSVPIDDAVGTKQRAARRISFDGAGIRVLCAAEPELGHELTRRLIEVVVERMQATRMRMLDLHNEAA